MNQLAQKEKIAKGYYIDLKMINVSDLLSGSVVLLDIAIILLIMLKGNQNFSETK